MAADRATEARQRAKRAENLGPEDCYRLIDFIADDVLWLLDERERLTAEAICAASIIDWCIGFVSAGDGKGFEKRLAERLTEARAALSALSERKPA